MRLLSVLVPALLLLTGCTLNLARVQEPPRSLAIPTAFPWNSMVYLARTDSGVVAIDLGWHGAGRSLRKGLREMGAAPEEVRQVFLTHSHRDHIGGWRAVRGARFHLARDEAPLFAGEERHGDLPSRAGERVLGRASPLAGQVRLHAFGADTAFVLGGDTLRAFLIPGHTPGSAAYLFRGVLFVGDAVAYDRVRGFHSAIRVFTHDHERSRASVASLWERVKPFPVRWVCTAHAKCAQADTAFMRRTLR